MQSQERELKTPDGTPIFITDWRPDSNEAREATWGGVVFMHGLGEHSGRYSHVARFFNDAGLTVRSYDHRGHGRSGGARGDVPNDDSLLHDAKLVVDDFAQQIGSAPFLLGHSMGGLIAARYAVEGLSPLRGLILSSPALILKLTTSQRLLFNILSMIAPGLVLPNGLEQRYLSHDQAIVDAYSKDPLVHAKISARLLSCMLKSIPISHSFAPGLKIPTLMLLAGDDHIVDASGGRAFCSLLPAGVGTSHAYPKMYHEIFNEVDAEPVFDDMQRWLQLQQATALRSKYSP